MTIIVSRFALFLWWNILIGRQLFSMKKVFAIHGRQAIKESSDEIRSPEVFDRRRCTHEILVFFISLPFIHVYHRILWWSVSEPDTR